MQLYNINPYTPFDHFNVKLAITDSENGKIIKELELYNFNSIKKNNAE